MIFFEVGSPENGTESLQNAVQYSTIPYKDSILGGEGGDAHRKTGARTTV